MGNPVRADCTTKQTVPGAQQEKQWRVLLVSIHPGKTPDEGNSSARRTAAKHTTGIASTPRIMNQNVPPCGEVNVALSLLPNGTLIVLYTPPLFAV